VLSPLTVTDGKLDKDNNALCDSVAVDLDDSVSASLACADLDERALIVKSAEVETVLLAMNDSVAEEDKVSVRDITAEVVCTAEVLCDKVT
jgi:hypothetical protein